MAEANSPHVEAAGDEGYLVTLPVAGGFAYLHFEGLTHGAHRLDGDLTVRVDLPAVSREPFSARRSLLSLSQRDTFRRQLSEVFGDLGWTAMLNRAASLVRQAYYGADPSVDLFDVPDRETDGHYRVNPLAPEGQASVLFGDGSSGKSYTALAAGLAVALGQEFAGMATLPGRVLLVDYETDAQAHRFRLGRLLAGQGLQWRLGLVSYWPARGKPLADIADALKRKVERDGISFIIIDSAAAACGGEPEKAESALRYFNSLAYQRVTSLSITHVPKDSDQHQPFGSVFWHNAARCTWNVRRIQAEGEDMIDLGLYCRKVNDGRLHSPIGLRLSFDGETGPVTVEREDIASVPELDKQRPLKARIRDTLKRGRQSIPRLAEILDADPATVKARLHEMKDEIVRLEIDGTIFFGLKDTWHGN
jgi:hypothetical protein